MEQASQVANTMEAKSQDTSQDDIIMLEIHSYFEMLGQNLEEHEVIDWLNIDSTDRGYSHSIDDEIIEEVILKQSQFETPSEDEENLIQTQDTNPSSSNATCIIHGQIVPIFEKFIMWLQQQDKTSVPSLTVLHDLQEFAAKKRLSLT